MNRRLAIAVLAFCLAYGTYGSASQPGARVRWPTRSATTTPGRYNRAVDTLTTARSQILRTMHPCISFWARAYYQLREFTRAVASLERAVQLAPEQFRISRLARQGLRAQGRGEHVSERDELGAKNAQGI